MRARPQPQPSYRLDGAFSGTPGWEYHDLDVRARDIEDGSHAPVGVLVDDLETTAHAAGTVRNADQLT